MPKYNLVLLDADNTLFVYDLFEKEALKKAFDYYKLEYSGEILNRYREINCFMWTELENGRIDKIGLQTERFKKLFEQSNINTDAKRFNSVYLDFLSKGDYLIDGALEVCVELAKHCTLVIVTNGIAISQRRRLKNSVIEPYIKHIIVSEDTGFQKPDRGFFQYAFDVCGQKDKEKVIIVGDSLKADIKGGANFGIATCWYNPAGVFDVDGHKIDYEIKNLRELINIVL